MAEDSPRPRKRRRIEWKGMFMVRVGAEPDHHVYPVHTNLFTKRSPFFKAAISSSWKKGDTPVDLTDHPVHIFEDYQDCVYHDRLQEITDEDAIDPTEFLNDLLDLYVLADKLGDLTTANYVMDQLVAKSDEWDDLPDDETSSRIFGTLPEGSPLRTLLVDWYVHEAAGSKGEHLSQELLDCVYKESRYLRNHDKEGYGEAVSKRTKSECCLYHQHNADHPACEPLAEVSVEEGEEEVVMIED